MTVYKWYPWAAFPAKLFNTWEILILTKFKNRRSYVATHPHFKKKNRIPSRPSMHCGNAVCKTSLIRSWPGQITMTNTVKPPRVNRAFHAWRVKKITLIALRASWLASSPGHPTCMGHLSTLLPYSMLLLCLVASYPGPLRLLILLSTWGKNVE